MLIGQGSHETKLTESDVKALCAGAFEQKDLDGKRVLCIIPDHSRTAPIDILFRVVYRLLSARVKALDFMIALGTHPPMSAEAIYERVGITATEHRSTYPLVRFYNHQWKKADQLTCIGTITGDHVADLSGGMMHRDVDITINKRIFDYDLLMIIGPTFPHEVVGFSGGNKYLFPGISGEEILNMFHWLGALITNPGIIGHKYTPVRQLVDLAAAMVPVERYCISLVVKGLDLVGMYIGSPEEAWKAAAELSDKVNIIYKDCPFQSVLSHAPEMYDDLWTGGKCMYKLEQVVADGGELIIYAPHINEVSVTHGHIIEEIGYHVLDYFTRQKERFRHIPGGIRAHSTHVKGIGTFEEGIEKPRINVILATGISREVCNKINLGYKDPESLRIEDYMNREEEGILYVPKAGEILYRLRDNPLNF
ncbi:MAG: DUF2088 domain-containing protein [Candidatus Marinimicrobia bacterium]|nr:DUF2088 domain-containing protein [Candidatus Neomarinimicrobiota bacterium]